MSQDDAPAFPNSLDGLSLTQLEALRAEMDTALKRMERDERYEALQQIHALIAQFSFLPFEVFPRAESTLKTKQVPDKYYDPDTGQSWSGRGKPPRWLQDKDRTQYLIQKEGILMAMENAGILANQNAAGRAPD